jgi:hypothetical protein
MLLMMILVEIMEDDEKGCLLFNGVAWDYKHSTPEVAQQHLQNHSPRSANYNATLACIVSKANFGSKADTANSLTLLRLSVAEHRSRDACGGNPRSCLSATSFRAA